MHSRPLYYVGGKLTCSGIIFSTKSAICESPAPSAV